MGLALPFVDLGDSVSVVDVKCGYGHTCALLMGGIMKCWYVAFW